MSKTLLALLFTLVVAHGSAFAANCTCWTGVGGGHHSSCIGRVHPFGGDLVACGNACKHYSKMHYPPGNYPYLEERFVKLCEEKNGREVILGPW